MIFERMDKATIIQNTKTWYLVQVIEIVLAS